MHFDIHFLNNKVIRILPGHNSVIANNIAAIVLHNLICLTLRILQIHFAIELIAKFHVDPTNHLLYQQHHAKQEIEYEGEKEHVVAS